MSKTEKTPMTANVGLWRCDAGYVSSAMRVGAIKKIGDYSRFCVFKNKYKQKGDRRPDYVLKIYNHEAFNKKLDELELREYCKEQEKEDVISVSDAIEVARNCLHDMEDGYSIDDLVVEVESFMMERSFSAIRSDENKE